MLGNSPADDKTNLNHNLLNHPPPIRNLHGTSAKVGEPEVGVDAQAVVDRGADVGWSHREVGHVARLAVGGAVQLAAANARAGQQR